MPSWRAAGGAGDLCLRSAAHHRKRAGFRPRLHARDRRIKEADAKRRKSAMDGECLSIFNRAGIDNDGALRQCACEAKGTKQHILHDIPVRQAEKHHRGFRKSFGICGELRASSHGRLGLPRIPRPDENARDLREITRHGSPIWPSPMKPQVRIMCPRSAPKNLHSFQRQLTARSTVVSAVLPSQNAMSGLPKQ